MTSSLFRKRWNGSESSILTINVLIKRNKYLSQHLKREFRAVDLLEYFSSIFTAILSESRISYLGGSILCPFSRAETTFPRVPSSV